MNRSSSNNIYSNYIEKSKKKRRRKRRRKLTPEERNLIEYIIHGINDGSKKFRKLIEAENPELRGKNVWNKKLKNFDIAHLDMYKHLICN